MISRIVVTGLAPEHNRDVFDCGEPVLNDYLRRFAMQNARQGLGRTWVVVEPQTLSVQGYYTLVGSSISPDVVPKKLPRYPVPAILLARLAVDRRFQGRRLGEDLLLDALARSADVADEIGVYAVVVDAMQAPVRDFYLKYGFQSLTDHDLHLFLPIKTIKQLVGSAK